MKKKTLFLLVSLVSSLLFAGQVPPDEQIAGKFTVKGVTVKLAHVYAFWKPRLMDESKSDLHILISDEPLSPDTIPANDDAVAKMAALVRDNKIHAFELHLDGDSDNLFGGEEAAVYDSSIAAARMGENGLFRFTPGVHDPAVKAGKVAADHGDWTCEATFLVALPKK